MFQVLLEFKIQFIGKKSELDRSTLSWTNTLAGKAVIELKCAGFTATAMALFNGSMVLLSNLTY